MPDFSTPITLSVSLPIAILLIAGIAGLIAILAVGFRLRSMQVKVLTAKLAAASTQAESPRQEELKSYLPDAYLQFIYNLSHEVANPLQSVQANLENMADCSPEESGRWRQYHAIIAHEMRRLSRLTENLRLLSQLESTPRLVKREPVNLKSVIEDVIMAQVDMAETKNVHLSYQGPSRSARVLGNRDLLHEVIMNLVDNSIKYSKDSGGEITISLNEGIDHTHITVKDTGLGIPDKDLPFIFDTAYRSARELTVHRTGSGLGLAIVKRIVEQHEGTVKAESIAGDGTKISVDLPLYRPT